MGEAAGIPGRGGRGVETGVGGVFGRVGWVHSEDTGEGLGGGGRRTPMASKMGRSAMQTVTARSRISPHEIRITASHTRIASPDAPAMT